MQSLGILTTSIAIGSNNNELVWVGIGLNIFATLINIYEKTNNSISSKLLNDIKLIKSNPDKLIISCNVMHEQLIIDQLKEISIDN